MAVRASVAKMANVGEQVADFGRPIGPTPCQESLEIGRCARLRRHYAGLRHVDATHPAIDAPGAEAQLPSDFRNGTAGFIQSSDLIEHGPASGVAPQPHQAFPCSGLRALVSLLGNRWHQRTLIILGAAKRCLPDCRLEAAKLPLDGLAQVLQQVEAICDLASLRRALTRGIRLHAGTIAADNLCFRM